MKELISVRACAGEREGRRPYAGEASFVRRSDREGRLLGKLESGRFSVLTLPMESEGVVVYENFSEFKDMESGEIGEGVDEYLINPNAEYHQRPGISPDLE